MEIFSDITIYIKKTQGNQNRLEALCWFYKGERRDSYCKFRGPFDELDQILEAVKAPTHSSRTAKSSTLSLQKTSKKDKYLSTQEQAVEVSEDVMSYITEHRAENVKKLLGDKFVIERLSDQRSSKTSSTMKVIIKPKGNSYAFEAQSGLIRQRFTTFYQRMASDLQVTSFHGGPEIKALKQDYPGLKFNVSSNNQMVTVMGPFALVAELMGRLSQKSETSSQRQHSRAPWRAQSFRSSASPTYIKDAEDDTCPICMDKISGSKKTLKCKHSFCSSCLKTAFQYKPVCPTCGELYGVLTGTQPIGGRMSVVKTHASLPGYERYGTIIINYFIPDGIQDEEHPNPGQPYGSLSRRAFLPDSSEGRDVLKLLQRAFDQRLIFTIGRSTTSGRNNVITWNDIHHKTSVDGGPTCYGYPDPDYLNRVRDELKVKGIV